MWKLRLLPLAPLACALASLVGAVLVPFPQKILFLFTTALFGFVAFIGFAVWSQGSNTIVAVSDGGLDVHVGSLSWNEIERIDFTSFGRRRALGIWAVDPFVLARRGRSPWLWVLGFLARMQGGPLIAYSELTVPIDELYAQIELRRTQTSTPVESERTGATATSPHRAHFE